MGCDIHLYVERLENGQWVSADKWTQDEVDPKRLSVNHEDQFYNDRCYSLFSILADVRNRDGFVPISKPCGVPADASQNFKDKVKCWGCDGHSHSWLTVQELLDFDWTKTATLNRGWRLDSLKPAYAGQRIRQGPWQIQRSRDTRLVAHSRDHRAIQRRQCAGLGWPRD